MDNPFDSSDHTRGINSPPRNPQKKVALSSEARKFTNMELDAPSAAISEQAKAPQDRELILGALSQHFLFTNLTEEHRHNLVNSMRLYRMAPRELVFEQNQPGHSYFVIAEGSVEVLINNHRVKVLEKGGSFGELALLHNSLRSATIRTLSNTELWGIDRPTFRTALQQVHEQHHLETRSFIENVPLFQTLTSQQKEALIASLFTLRFRANDKIVNEGDPGDLFYLLTQGVVSCIKSDSELRKMYPGEFFGEQALLYDSPRTASIVAISDVKCLAIGRDDLKKALGSQLMHLIYKNSIRIAFDRSAVFSGLSAWQITRVLDNLDVKSYRNGQKVILAGIQKGQFLWVVVKGCLCSPSLAMVANIFSCVGEMQLLQDSDDFYMTDVLADGEVDIAEISKQELEALLGCPLETALMRSETFQALRKSQLFSGLSYEKLYELTSVMRLEEYSDNHEIITQDLPGDSLFLIKTGRVSVYMQDKLVRTITINDYFGERSLLFDEARTATVRANGQVACWVLHKEDFFGIITEKLRNILLRRIELQDDKITLEELQVVKTLGRGMFGNVFLAHHRQRNTLYALKAVDRRKINRYQIEESLVLERKILMQLDHGFIMKLVKTFKDKHRVYFLTEFVPGLDLFDVIRVLGIVSEQESKLYVACLVLILEHLHERDIIYRDLKPENVMVDEEGYPKLIDFGTAKTVSHRTYTVVGTPHYMAPEVITGKGYSSSADFWSVGVMLFEFTCGGVPFGEDEQDPIAIYKTILEHRLVFPNYDDLKGVPKPMISQLLSQNPALRTGGSAQMLKRHQWFSSVDWDLLINRGIPMPYRPEVPDLRGEIRGGSLHETILREEMQTEVPPAVRPRKPPRKNWDAEF